MIEIFSNFYLIHKNDELENTQILNSTKKYTIDPNNVSSILDISLNNYKKLETIVIVYNDNKSIEMFLHLLLQKHVKIMNRKDADDILIMNECIFL